MNALFDLHRFELHAFGLHRLGLRASGSATSGLHAFGPRGSHGRPARSAQHLVALLSCALLLLSACSGGVVVHDTIPPPPPPPPVWWEGEPNDTAWQAPWFGALFPGEEVWITGFSTADGSDPQDGLAFTGYGPLRIDFTLFVDDPWTDLDVWLYHPASGQFLHAFTSAYGDESGTFWLDGTQDFHLIVVPSAGASNWTLGVWASGPMGAYSAEGAGAPVVITDATRAENAAE